MKVTGVFVITILLLAFLFEVYTVSNKTPGDTISEFIWSAITQRPFIPFLAGFVCGHFFWQRKSVYGA